MNFVKNAAMNSIERPNLARAFVFFLLPLLFTLVIAVLIGLSVNLGLFAFNAFLGVVNWFLSAVVLYIIIHLFKGKTASGKFSGILAGLALRYVFVFVLMLLVFGVLFVVVPEFFPLVAKAQAASSAEAAYNIIGQNLDSLGQKNVFLLFGGFGLIIVATAIVFLLVLYLVFELIAFSGKGSPRQNLLILFLWVVAEAIILGFL